MVAKNTAVISTPKVKVTKWINFFNWNISKLKASPPTLPIPPFPHRPNTETGHGHLKSDPLKWNYGYSSNKHLLGTYSKPGSVLVTRIRNEAWHSTCLCGTYNIGGILQFVSQKSDFQWEKGLNTSSEETSTANSTSFGVTWICLLKS